MLGTVESKDYEMRTYFMMTLILGALLTTVFGSINSVQAESGAVKLKKIKDIVVYQNDHFYPAFPSVVTRPSGELVLAFRRAPDLRIIKDGGPSHTDFNSNLVLVRSKDNGETWSKNPELIFAHPWGGSQDPCMLQLHDGSILCTSYTWYLPRSNSFAGPAGTTKSGKYFFLGGYLMKSKDGGRTWAGPIVPPPVPGVITRDVFGKPLPAYNRGALCQGKDGKIYWAVASEAKTKPKRTEVHLMVSEDGGLTWTYRCPIAQDPKIAFNEASIYETPSGQLITFLRTAGFKDHTVIARSTNGGKSFKKWEDTGFQGHPHYALKLPNDQILLIYGYRHKPYGIRARILDSEGRKIANSKEIIIRDDGGTSDLGYPWATMMADGRVLVVYYFNKKNMLSHIAGTILEIEK
jgi:sialidase-1